jgi:hypothetical protein
MKIEYHDKIVAFVDVLGFSTLVYAESMEPIQRFFDYITEEFKEDSKTFKFCYHLISDAIVIHTDNTKGNLEQLIISLGKLQMKLITRGLLVRGAISFGNLYTNSENNIIVGTGLINAYQLEGQAVYPRIIIDRKLVGRIYGNISKLLEDNHGRVRINPPHAYKKDSPYISYTRKLSLVMQKNKLATVIQLIKENYFRNSNIEKYVWLVAHLLGSLDEQIEFLKGRTGLSVAIAARDRRRLNLLNNFRKELIIITGDETPNG